MDNVDLYTKYLGKKVKVEIDRPKGSSHPRLDFIYETNYGFLPGTRAGDGQEIDAYVLGEDSALTDFEGKCVAVIVRKDDDEHKLVVSNQLFEPSRIVDETAFVEKYFDTELILEQN